MLSRQQEVLFYLTAQSEIESPETLAFGRKSSRKIRHCHSKLETFSSHLKLWSNPRLQLKYWNAKMETMVFHSITESFFAPETLRLLTITLLVMAEKQRRQVRRWLTKGRGEILPPENTDMEASNELGDEKITDKFGTLIMIPGSCHVLW